MDVLTRSNMIEEKFRLVYLFGKPGIFSDKKIDKDVIPYGWHCCELMRKSETDSAPILVARKVDYGFCGSILSPRQIRFRRNIARPLGNPALKSYKLKYDREVFINQFCDIIGIKLPEYYWNSIL